MPRTGCSPNRKNGLVIWLAALIVSALLAGCSSGANIQSVETEVDLETLVAEAVLTSRALTPAYSTGLPTALSARTSTPTITPPVTATLPATLTPSATIFFTPTLPAVPDRNPEDPASRFGEPDWSDSFDTTDNWSVYETTQAKMEITGGELRYTLFEAGKGPTWTLSWPTVTNFYLETTVLSPQECSGKDSYGVVFRSPDANQGYRFELFCDGGYRLVEFSPTGIQTLAGGFSHESINAGPNQINRLGIWAQNKVLVIYVNGVALAGPEDNTYRQAGRFGFSINTENTEPFTVVFDNLSFWTFD